MKKSTEFFLALSVVFLILVSFLLVFSPPKPLHAFSFEEQGVVFVSDFAPPAGHLRELAKRDSFVISSEFLEGGSGTTSFMTQPITLFNSVLVSQGRFVVTVAKTVGADKGLALCDTNDGNKLSNRAMGPAECAVFFEKTPHVVFLVALPDSSLEKSVVEVFESRVLIRPNSFEAVSQASFLVLKAMFADSKETIDLINQLLEHVKG